MGNAWDALPLHGAESHGVRLRLATETDLSEILKMLLEPSTLAAIGETAEHAQQALLQLWQEDPATSGLRHFVVERAGTGGMIAYLRLEYPFNEPGCLWLTFFCVASEHRGKGCGRRIMALLTATAARSRCVKGFGVHTRVSNAAAVGLYQSSGFRCVKREPWQSSNGDSSDRLTFCRMLSGAVNGGRVEATAE
jgi:ribosomal protein S18 acetylase RimI-like enzyme